jgi:hypothetical protein
VGKFQIHSHTLTIAAPTRGEKMLERGRELTIDSLFFLIILMIGMSYINLANTMQYNKSKAILHWKLQWRTA